MSKSNEVVQNFRRQLKRCIECGQSFGNFYPDDGLCSICKYNQSIFASTAVCKTCGHGEDRHGTHYDSSTSCRGDVGLLQDRGCNCDQLRLGRNKEASN